MGVPLRIYKKKIVLQTNGTTTTNFNLKRVGKLQSTQFEANLELHIVLKIATCKISITLNNF
jgi:hypothetical protein